jgi:hypothetical protein
VTINLEIDGCGSLQSLRNIIYDCLLILTATCWAAYDCMFVDTASTQHEASCDMQASNLSDCSISNCLCTFDERHTIKLHNDHCRGMPCKVIVMHVAC